MKFLDKIKEFLNGLKISKLTIFLLGSIVILIFVIIGLHKDNLNQKQSYLGEISLLEYRFRNISGELDELKNNMAIEQKESQKSKIIEMVKSTIDPTTGKTYGDSVQKTIEDDGKKNIQYKWNIEYVSEFETYKVSFVDTIEERGKFWEVDLGKNTVRNITSNWQLRRKYELTPLKRDNMFSIENIKNENLFVKNDYYNTGIVYKITVTIKNNSEKDITNCAFFSQLIINYSDQKIIEAESNVISLPSISIQNPWISGRSKEITLETKPYDITLRNFNPLDAFAYIYIIAVDPLGYEYSGAIKEQNIKKLFENLE